MGTKLFAPLLLAVGPLSLTAAHAQEESPGDMRGEIRELRRQLTDVLTQMRTLEKRLLRLEAKMGAQYDAGAERTRQMRPLGRWFVDENGVIRTRAGSPVGFWGVNEVHMQQPLFAR